MKCCIQWIDDQGDPTPDTNPAEAVAYQAHYTFLGFPAVLRGDYSELQARSFEVGGDPEGYPICAHHAKQVLEGRAQGWYLMTIPYYTLHVPYRAKGATVWHPTTKEGPFSVLTRGTFRTPGEAEAWARVHLGPDGWSIEKVQEVI